MKYGWKDNDKRIPFERIEVGDRLRVRYSDGGGVKYVGGHAINAKGCVGFTRTMVSTAHFLALDKVWLDENGVPLAHRDWYGMEIILLEREDKQYVPEPQGAGHWTKEEVEYLVNNWELPMETLSHDLKRSVRSIVSKRWFLRKKAEHAVRA